MSSDMQLRQEARARAEAKLGFYIHFAVYSGVNLLLFLIWFFITAPVNVFPWFLFPLAFWGIGIVAHYLTVFGGTGYLDRMTEKEYRKLKTEQ